VAKSSPSAALEDRRRASRGGVSRTRRRDAEVGKSGRPKGVPKPEAAESLDPTDWNAFRTLAHKALDEAVDYVEGVRDRPVWQPVPESIKKKIAEPLPVEPQGLTKAYRDFLELILPYPTGNIHPRFFGWVHGVGLTSGIVAELLAAALDSNCGGRNHSGLYVERAVIEWCRAMFGFPNGTTGILLTGTSMANATGLAVARSAHAPKNVRVQGLRGQPRTLVAYTSEEAHHSVTRAADLLGFGSEALRHLPVDGDFRIDIGALRRAIAEDRKAGLEPFCVIGTAGTVNTAAIDDLQTLADICRDEKLWFHVDGAFGSLAVLSDELRPRLRGIERADSLAFDFHKWFHVQYDAGCLLVRDGDKHRAAFSVRPAYLHPTTRGLGGGGDWPYDFGPELSRGFRALKIWFAIKEHGVARFGRAIERNCRQAHYLAGLVRRTPGAELLCEPSLNIVCFRFHPKGWDDAALDQLNEDIVADLQESGIAAPSTTRIRGALAIRANLTNHRTRQEDLDLMVRAAADFAAKRIAKR
jgi:glutamate/tyrosine decarboxylase-like PLP-dependent enzyme